MSEEFDFDRELDPYVDAIDMGARPNYVGVGEVSYEERIVQNRRPPELAVTDEMIEQDATNPDSWLTYNKGLEEQGFSPANGLTTDNVDQLSREWVLSTDSSGLQTDPIVVPTDPPAMYVTQNNQVVQCLDARTGDTFWRYEYPMPEDPDYEPLPRDRGAVVYGDNVYFGTAVMSMLALNRYTGEPVWETDGLTEEQYRNYPYPWVGYGFAQAPLAYDGKIFAGQSGGDSSPPGWTYALAFDAESGEVMWETNLVPKDQWIGETWRHGNGSAWMTAAYDTETDTLLWNTGNPGPMLNGLVRPGPNQMTAGIVAIDATTGEVKWNDQMVAHDIWDYDGQFTPQIAEMEVDGEATRVVIAPHKTGWAFVYDIETGQLLTRSEPFAKQDGNFLGMHPIGEENGRVFFPGTAGGAEWSPDTYSPRTGLEYIGANDAGHKAWMELGWEYGVEATTGGGTDVPPGLGEDVFHEAYVRAVDPASGKVVWEHQLPDVNPEWGMWRMWTGGTTATAGGLVFHGSSGGDLIALDDESGDRLWRDDTGGRITASPVTWLDPDVGKQYVSVASDDEIVTYSADVSGDG
ncbi:outer membrane protein assembly factor BamB family protein [Halorussus litoreus]|uniref:outer membrane protein assembly factor BamB family protein n=1 Tax=Halorussus litoreus TaxID=1710536 RepID=UPI000E2838D0|nr:PQQ-binding-like beta-propeller repeat protein [Halorussus litoreus]